MQDSLKYLQPAVVAQLANMELRARFVVEGFITGLHKSPYHGFSVEFTEHRPYMPGDEIKHIDWKAYGKTDRFYIKQFEEETNLKSYLILDASRSMEYASKGNLKKFEYASYVAAALSFLMIEQRDAVGLLCKETHEDTIRFAPPLVIKKDESLWTWTNDGHRWLFSIVHCCTSLSGASAPIRARPFHHFPGSFAVG